MSGPLTAPRVATSQLGAGPIDNLVYLPVAANAVIYAGAIVAVELTGATSPGYATQAITSTHLACVGRANVPPFNNNVINNTGGVDGAISVQVQQGVFPFNIGASADALTQADVGEIVYLVDDQTVGRTSGTSTRSIAGVLQAITTQGTTTQAWVQMNLAQSGFAQAIPTLTNPLPATQGGTGAPSPTAHGLLIAEGASAMTTLPTTLGGIPLGQGASADPVVTLQMGRVHNVRGVVTGNIASLASFTVASNDGLTYAAGQRVLLVGQTTKTQNGVYVVGTVTTGTAPLTRPTDFTTGTVIPSGTIFSASEGTLFAQSLWKITTAAVGGITIDTTTFDVYPKSVTQQVTLVAGTVTITNTPLLSASKSVILVDRVTPNTSDLTVGGYYASTRTPGIVGTASIVVQAQVAAGTLNNADISVINVCVQNW